jgi:hypothetical protein
VVSSQRAESPGGVLAVVGDAQQELVPGERGAHRRHAVYGGDQPPGRRIQGGCRGAEVEGDGAARGHRGQCPWVPGGAVRTAAVFGQDADRGDRHERLKAERPQPCQSWGQAARRGDGVEHVVAECGAVGEDRQGAKLACGVDGEVGAVAVFGWTRDVLEKTVGHGRASRTGGRAAPGSSSDRGRGIGYPR